MRHVRLLVALTVQRIKFYFTVPLSLSSVLLLFPLAIPKHFLEGFVIVVDFKGIAQIGIDSWADCYKWLEH